MTTTATTRQPVAGNYVIMHTRFGFKNLTTRVKVLRDLSDVEAGLFTGTPANGGLDMFYEYTFRAQDIVSFEDSEYMTVPTFAHKDGLVFFS